MTDLASVFGGVWTRLRADPQLLVPFAVAGIVAAVIDEMLSAAPIPVVLSTTVQHGPGHVTLQPIPAVVSPLSVSPSALVGLRLDLLLGTTVGELVATTTGITAGVTVLHRTLDRRDASLGETLARRVPVLVGYQLSLGGLFWLLAPVVSDLGLATLIVLVVLFHVAARLSLVPVGVVAGRRLDRAVRWSWRRSDGEAWTLAGLVVIVGVAGTVLVSLPVLLAPVLTPLLPVAPPDTFLLSVGTLVATTLVGPVHACALVTATEQIEVKSKNRF